MHTSQIKKSILLLIAAIIWGSTYVAQSAGMNYVGPYTFMFCRSFISILILGPIALIYRRFDTEGRKLSPEDRYFRKRLTIKIGMLSGFLFGTAITMQQVGQQFTTVGKAGFITGTYIVWVPLIALFLGRKSGKQLWASVALAVVGLYLLCMTGGDPFNLGDILIFVSSIILSFHILVLARWSSRVDPVLLSFQQFLIATVLSGIMMVLFEHPVLSEVYAAGTSILFAAVMSNVIAGTLQIMGQRNLNPAVASLIMSLEAPISVLAGLLMLNEHLSSKEIIGCCLMFTAIMLAQIPQRKTVHDVASEEELEEARSTLVQEEGGERDRPSSERGVPYVERNGPSCHSAR